MPKRRNQPADDLDDRSVGEVVSGVVTGFQGNGGLWLEVDGVIGGVSPRDLVLADGQSAQERYAVGDAVDDLFVWQVNHDARTLHLSGRRNAPGYVEALSARSVGEVVSGVVTDFPNNGGLWLEVDGVIGSVSPDELVLAGGESAQDRYAVGDTVHDLFVWQVDHSTRDLDLSMRRSAPGYVEALAAHSVGEVVSGVVSDFTSNGGLWLDVDGVIGGIDPIELGLADGQSAQERYAVGEPASDLFVWQVNHDARGLVLSVRRNTPGYVEALAARSVGEFVSGVVTGFPINGGLWLEVDGVIGGVLPGELVLAEGQSAQERYPVGSTVEQLFVWQVDHDTRDLFLSVRRNAPGYVEALAARSVGEVVSGVVTDFTINGGLWLDVDGVIGSVSRHELALADGESAQDRYAVGYTVSGLFVWQIDHDARDLLLSVRRNVPGYVEALTAHSGGEVVDGVVTQSTKWGIWLVAAGVVGWIPATEMTLDEGQSPRDRYAINEPVKAQVRLVDHLVRDVILSVRRLRTDFIEEPIALGATVKGVYLDSPPRGIRVLAAGRDLPVPRCELSLSIGDRPRFEYGQAIRLVVLAVDSNGQPTALSHRRALPNWQAEANRLVPGVIVQDAQIIPLRALPPGEDRTGVDLGPVTGFVAHAEISAGDAREMMLDEPNTQYSVVIESIDADRGDPIVSHDKFEERWRELAADLQEGAEIDPELRGIDGNSAFLDLGSGLLAEMPIDQLPLSETTGATAHDRIGEVIPVRITRKDEDALVLRVEHRDQEIERLIQQGESQTLEFKATLLYSPRTGERDENATFGVLKSIAGFLNAWNGGTLLVGVDNSGNPITSQSGQVGVLSIDGFDDDDKEAQVKKDQMILNLKDLIKERVNIEVFSWLNIYFTDFRRTQILRIDCEPADTHVWLKHKKENIQDFFLRTSVATEKLEGPKLGDYLTRRFSQQSGTGD